MGPEASSDHEVYLRTAVVEFLTAHGQFAEGMCDVAALQAACGHIERLRDVFHRMGFDARDIVALSGAHTVGRAFAERSGTSAFGYGAKRATRYTGGCPFAPRKDGREGVGDRKSGDRGIKSTVLCD